MQLICMSSSDDSKDLPKFSDASCQANENQSRSESFEKVTKNGSYSYC